MVDGNLGNTAIVIFNIGKWMEPSPMSDLITRKNRITTLSYEKASKGFYAHQTANHQGIQVLKF